MSYNCLVGNVTFPCFNPNTNSLLPHHPIPFMPHFIPDLCNISTTTASDSTVPTQNEHHNISFLLLMSFIMSSFRRSCPSPISSVSGSPSCNPTKPISSISAQSQPHVRIFQHVPSSKNTKSSTQLVSQRHVFVEAFTHAYSSIEQAHLDIGSNQQLHDFLHSAFDEEEQAFLVTNNDHNKTTLFYGATVQDKEVAYMSVDLHMCKDAYIRQLAVLPTARRTGIASKMIQFFMESNSDLQVIRVACRIWNKSAVHLYTKLGFQRDQLSHAQLDPNAYIGFKLNLS